MTVMIHPTAICEPESSLGEGVKVWHFCHVMGGARIGPDSSLGQGCFVASSAVIGRGVKLQNHVSVFDGVQLQDYVFCGPGVVFTNVRTPRSEISRRDVYETTVVRVGASIGANATIRCGVTIGRYAMIGAGAVVVTNVPDFAMYIGNPARQRGWVGRGGTQLCFDERGRALCPDTGFAYCLRDGLVSESDTTTRE